MIEIHTAQGRQCASRTYITYGRRTNVIDGGFTGESRDVRTGNAATPYLYGT